MVLSSRFPNVSRSCKHAGRQHLYIATRATRPQTEEAGTLCEASVDLDTMHQGRRAVMAAALCTALVSPPSISYAASEADVTDKVFFEIGLCPEGLNRDRRMGDKSALCPAPSNQGRMVIGLYGKVAPQTVTNFLKLVEEGVYTGTVFHKVIPGKYIQAGRQGSKRYGRVDSLALRDIPAANSDVVRCPLPVGGPIAIKSPEREYRGTNACVCTRHVSSAAFSLGHTRAGTLSLCIGENDDDVNIKGVPGYKNTEFMITTGPGPTPSLDGENLVFGRVLEGFGTLSSIVAVPTIRPNEQLERMNAIASFIGDERAAKARQQWDSPLKAVIITNAGVL